MDTQTQTRRVVAALTCFGTLALAALPLNGQTHHCSKLLADDARPGDSLGTAVALGDGVALVGCAWDDNQNGVNAGSAYLFDLESGEQLHKLVAENGKFGDQLGSSVALAGGLALVGARQSDEDGDLAGSAYLFDLSTGGQMRKLLVGREQPVALLGSSVALRGHLAVVGAPGALNEAGERTGAVYLFDTATGELVRALHAADGETDDRFGQAVAVGVETVVVAAPRDDNENGRDAGALYLFALSTGEQLAKVVPEHGQEGEHVGVALAADGTSAVVGTFTGRVLVLDLPSRQQTGELRVEILGGARGFGEAVALYRNFAVVGAWAGYNDNGHSAGSAYLFNTRTGTQLAQMIAGDGSPGDYLGYAVAISADRVAASARLDDDRGLDSGSVYLFGTVSCPPDLNCDGGVDSRDFLVFLDAWAADDALSDWDGNGQIDTRDFIAYRGDWSSGCP